MITLVYFLLFLLPLLVLPVTVSPFEAPKVILAEILIEVFAVIIILRSGAAGEKLPLPLIALFILSLIHLIFFRTPTTFFGNPFRLQGIFLLWHLILFSYLVKYIKLDQIAKFIPFLSLAGILLAAIILGGNEAGRAVGTLGEPNALAAAAVFIWPFSWFKPVYQNRSFKFISPILSFIIIFLSGSRSGLLAFIIQVVFLILTTSLRGPTQSDRGNLYIRKAVILCLILIFCSLTLPFIESGGPSATLRVNWFENRSEVWKTALLAGLKSPIIGSGFGNIEYSLKDISRQVNNNIQYQYVDSSHNFLLDYWVQGGILGLTILISILYLSLLTLVRNKDRLLLCSFLGILTVMSFNPVSVVTLLAFWYLIGKNIH